ncbi:unnamed protein product [Sphagnum balticum]
MEREVNIGVVHQRVVSQTAAMYSRGQIAESSSYNNQWSDYLNSNSNFAQYAPQQEKFNSHNRRLNEAISHKVKKMEMLSSKRNEIIREE